MTNTDLRTLANELDTTMTLVRDLVHEVQVGPGREHLRGRLVELADRLAGRPDLTELPVMIVRAYSGLTEALGGIRVSREAIQSYAADRINRSQARLNEVSSATESATLELMNGIDRALAIIDELGREEQPADDTTAPINTLRDELNQLFGHLQFQDITAQQIAGVAAALEEIERQVHAVALLFDQHEIAGMVAATPAAPAPPVSTETLTYNADASFDRSIHRQAQADQAFAQAANPRP
jgi:chemotaxis regulatin CheY-phosphate phosphatase CheZ